MPDHSTLVADTGERLDRAIAGHFSDISRSYAAALIEAGAVLVNGRVAGKPGQRLKAGDHISIEMPPPRPSGLAAEEITQRRVRGRRYAGDR